MHTQYIPALSLAAVFALVGRAPAQPRPKPNGTPPSMTLPGAATPSSPTSPAAGVNYPTEVGGRKLEEWLKDIESPDPSVREGAIRVVVQFGPPARRAIPALVRQCRILNDLSPQASAIIALSELVPQSQPSGGQPDGYTRDAVDALGQLMDSTQAIIRYRAATALAWIGPPARAALPKLIIRIEDKYSFEIRKAVCGALGTVGRDEQGWPILNALEALAKGAADRDSRDVRIEALQSIISLGPPYGGVPPPQLTAVLKQRLSAERDKAALIWVRVALMRLDPPSVTDANITLISKQMFAKPGVTLEQRVQAAKALGYMGAAGKPGLTDMIEALQKSEEKVLTVQLCWSLARMGQYAERAIPALNQVRESYKDAKGDTEKWVSDSARVAVETIDKAVQQAKAPPAKP
jgi:HEAT repeat protein